MHMYLQEFVGFVFCEDSDMEFWADSESSEQESDESSTDPELSDAVRITI